MNTNKITSLIFCALIGVISVASVLSPARAHSETENRDLAQLPEFSLDYLFNGDYTLDYETYITDQFVARDKWIAMHTASEFLLGKRDISGVYIADDGYYIERVTPDAERLDKNVGYLSKLVENLSDDYNLRVMIAPTASLICEDKLPALATTWDQAGMLDRIAALDGAIDLRETLNAHKDEYLYYRTDHHWTTQAAYYAYRELASSLGFEPLAPEELTETVLTEEFLGTTIAKVGIRGSFDTITRLEAKSQPTVKVDFNEGMRTSDSLYVEEKLATRDKYGYFLGTNEPIADISTSVKNGRTLLMIKDSYSHCMVPMLANHYEQLILIDLRYLSIGVTGYLERLAANGVSVDDIVVLYNAAGFAEDRTLIWMSK